VSGSWIKKRISQKRISRINRSNKNSGIQVNAKSSKNLSLTLLDSKAPLNQEEKVRSKSYRKLMMFNQSRKAENSQKDNLK
jgi:hypothetical protein